MLIYKNYINMWYTQCHTTQPLKSKVSLYLLQQQEWNWRSLCWVLILEVTPQPKDMAIHSKSHPGYCKVKAKMQELLCSPSCTWSKSKALNVISSSSSCPLNPFCKTWKWKYTLISCTNKHLITCPYHLYKAWEVILIS